MAAKPDDSVLEGFLEELETLISGQYSSLLELFLVFANEARFGRRWMEEDLQRLPPGACILEIGGGVMLLAASLQREGYLVTVLEPIGKGFSAFLQLQKIVLEHAAGTGCAPEVLPTRAEDFIARRVGYDFAFSINVMEHVDDVKLALVRISVALNPGAQYRFTCPNYLFPYEPHFGIPTLFSKKLTWALMKGRILTSRKIADPEELWASLNWISVPKLMGYAKKRPDWEMRFDKGLFSSTLERLVTDDQFASRHSGWVHWIGRLLANPWLNRVLQRMPVQFLPIIDCSLGSGMSR